MKAVIIKVAIILVILFHQVWTVFLILDAVIIQQIRVGFQKLRKFHRPRASVCLGIVHRDLNLQLPEVHPPDPLRDFRRLRQRAAVRIQPQVIAKAAGLHYQRVSVPFPRRVADPGRLWIRWQRPSVRENLAWIFSSGQHGEFLLWLLVAYIAFFAFSQGAVIWVYISEVFPNLVRAKGQSLGSFTHWIMNAIISAIFPIMAKTSGAAPFVFFAAMMALQFAVVLTIYPETKGVSLENMEAKLEGRGLPGF